MRSLSKFNRPPPVLTTDDTQTIKIWDTLYNRWIEIDLVFAIETVRAAHVRDLEAKGREAETK